MSISQQNYTATLLTNSAHQLPRPNRRDLEHSAFNNLLLALKGPLSLLHICVPNLFPSAPQYFVLVCESRIERIIRIHVVYVTKYVAYFTVRFSVEFNPST